MYRNQVLKGQPFPQPDLRNDDRKNRYSIIKVHVPPSPILTAVPLPVASFQIQKITLIIQVFEHF